MNSQQEDGTPCLFTPYAIGESYKVCKKVMPFFSVETVKSSEVSIKFRRYVKKEYKMGGDGRLPRLDRYIEELGGLYQGKANEEKGKFKMPLFIVVRCSDSSKRNIKSRRNGNQVNNDNNNNPTSKKLIINNDQAENDDHMQPKDLLINNKRLRSRRK